MFSIFKPKKTEPCRVDINNKELVINVEHNEILLAAALKNGVKYPHNCRVGTCGQCKTKLISGKIKPLIDFALSPLTAEELSSGHILACQSKVQSNLEISIPTEQAESRSGKIMMAQKLPGNVLALSIELDQPLKYQAGQYANLSLQNSDLARSYSFSQEPKVDGNILVNFLIRRIPGGAFSDHLWHNAKPGMLMTLEGPYGSMGNADTDENAICVAGGTGLAPVLSIVRDRLLKSTSARFLILLGVRNQGDYFAEEIFQELKSFAAGRVQTRLILSDEPSESDWTGDRGLVTALLTKDLLNQAQASSAIVCGAAQMVKATQEELIRLGIPDKNIHSDTFVPSGKSAKKY